MPSLEWHCRSRQFDEYEAITAVNLTGFFRITQLAIAEMVARSSGHVVNVSTSLVDNADNTRPSALPALTKGGLVASSGSLAIEYASRSVRHDLRDVSSEKQLVRTAERPDAY